jgi:hypothetical protein
LDHNAEVYVHTIHIHGSAANCTAEYYIRVSIGPPIDTDPMEKRCEEIVRRGRGPPTVDDDEEK